MGMRRRRIPTACLAACVGLFVAARAQGATVMEPVARLSLEGGYDSNVLYDGSGSDRTGRISPDVGLRLRNHRLDLKAVYGGDWITYQERQSGGTWNHRASLELEGQPTRRVSVLGRLRGGYAFDPVGLALLGVFRSGRDSAFTADGLFRAQWRATERVDVAGTLTERTVFFSDETGGAMHQPGVEALWRSDRRVDVGAGYRLGVFQGFEPEGQELAYAHALRAQGRWRASRRLQVDASAGPAVWLGDGDTAVVPEATVHVVGSSRWWDARVGAYHALGLGNTARPGLVDGLEVAGIRRVGLRWVFRADAGLWRSGRAPSGGDAVTGYAVGGEAALLVGGGVRLGLGATHLARVDDPSAALRRTTLGLRLGWELPLR
jgi:hypothetical protein